MPDIHWGYGFPIGGVVATDWRTGSCSPGGVGYDINCGVRLLRDQPRRRGRERAHGPAGRRALPGDPVRRRVDRAVPSRPRTSGGGPPGGRPWAVAQGYGEGDDLGTDGVPRPPRRRRSRRRSAKASSAAGRSSARSARATTSSRCRSWSRVPRRRGGRARPRRGPRDGHDPLRLARARLPGLRRRPGVMQGRDAPLRDRAARPPARLRPGRSPEGQAYLGAMRAAANFALQPPVPRPFAREAFERALGVSPRELGWRLVYDVAHNIAKEEARGRRTLSAPRVHRKGATRAFPPGHPELPDAYRKIGQPVIIPGDMGRASWVLVGAPGACGTRSAPPATAPAGS